MPKLEIVAVASCGAFTIVKDGDFDVLFESTELSTKIGREKRN